MAGPMLKVKNMEKMHISKGPGVRSWGILLGLLVLGLGAAVCIADSVIAKTLSIFVCLLLGLLCMDDWEDCVLDRYQDQVTLTRSNWYDRLCCRVPESNTRVLSLSNIVGVQAVGTQGLSFVLTSGNSTPVMTKPVEYREGISLGNHISLFLRLERVEPVVEDLGYEEEEWDDVALSESSGSDSVSVVLEGNHHNCIMRRRDEIKVLSEPAPQNVLQ